MKVYIVNKIVTDCDDYQNFPITIYVSLSQDKANKIAEEIGGEIKGIELDTIYDISDVFEECNPEQEETKEKESLCVKCKKYFDCYPSTSAFIHKQFCKDFVEGDLVYVTPEGERLVH